MNLHAATSFDINSNIDCIIIPIIVTENNDFSAIKTKYKIPGFNRLIDDIKKTDGSFTSCFLDSPSEKEYAIILLNCSATLASAQNQQMVDFATKNKALLNGRIAIDLNQIANEDSDILPALLRSIFMAHYDIGKYKSEEKSNHSEITDLILFSEQEDDGLSATSHRAEAAAKTILSCMELVDAPANVKTPEHLAKWITSSAQENGYSVEVFEKDQLEEMGFHALLAVNRGSEDAAKCLVAQYHGKNTDENTPTIALVGKGVTFDTGGLSIKPSQNMHYMKSDMGGASAVMGTIELVAKLGLNINLVAVVPCTDNSVDSMSIKPGDVIKSYKGSTIEVIDTDAEGRLILADGLAYAIDRFKPDYIVDLATLTGSIVRTLGNHAAGLMTKSDFMSSSLIEAGVKSGDRVWPLPMWDEYNKYMASDVADIRNLSTKPVAGAITAGKFLEHFTDEHENWAHLDIAGTAFGTSPFAKGYSASGFGILLLLSWIELIIQK